MHLPGCGDGCVQSCCVGSGYGGGGGIVPPPPPGGSLVTDSSGSAPVAGDNCCACGASAGTVAPAAMLFLPGVIRAPPLGTGLKPPPTLSNTTDGFEQCDHSTMLYFRSTFIHKNDNRYRCFLHLCHISILHMCTYRLILFTFILCLPYTEQIRL